jgi:hypothetical protein
MLSYRIKLESLDASLGKSGSSIPPTLQTLSYSIKLESLDASLGKSGVSIARLSKRFHTASSLKALTLGKSGVSIAPDSPNAFMWDQA